MRAADRIPTSAKLLAAAAVFLASMGGHFRTPLLPDIGNELGMSAASLGLLGTAFGLGRLATDLPAGSMSDRLSPHRVFGVAGTMILIGAVAFALAPQPAWVMVGAFALGVGSSLANAAGVTFFLTGADRRRRGRAMAWFSGALLTGQAAGPAVSGAVADAGTWRTSMWVASGFGIALLTGTIVTELRSSRRLADRPGPTSTDGDDQPATVGDQPATVGGQPTTAAVPKTGGQPPGDSGDDEVATGMSLRERWALYGVSFAMMFTIASMPQTLIPIIGGDGLGLPVATIGTALGIGGIARLVGTFLGGWMTDRFERRLVLGGGMSVTGMGIALLTVEGSVTLWYASIVLMSVSSFGLATASAMISDRVPSSRVGREIGAARFVGDAGVVTGPVLAAYVLGAVGQTAAVWLVTGVVVASVVSLALFVPRLPGNVSAS